MKTVKINQKSNFSIILFILMMILLAVGSTAFGQKNIRYKLSTYKVEEGSAVRLEKTESVDSILLFSQWGQQIEAKKIVDGDEVGFGLGGDSAWFVKIITKADGVQWYRLHKMDLDAVKDPF